MCVTHVVSYKCFSVLIVFCSIFYSRGRLTVIFFHSLVKYSTSTNNSHSCAMLKLKMNNYLFVFYTFHEFPSVKTLIIVFRGNIKFYDLQFIFIRLLKTWKWEKNSTTYHQNLVLTSFLWKKEGILIFSKREKKGNFGFPSPHFANFGLGKMTVPLFFSR